jgi:hypothetical protein
MLRIANPLAHHRHPPFIAHRAGNREHDARYWAEVHRYGMTQVSSPI